MFFIPQSWYTIKILKKKGRGVFALRDIPAGTVLGDYTGKLVRPEDEDEEKEGLYTIEGGERYDILADPKEKGLHCINHSCAANSGIYPYRGHMLFITVRKIFKGEEITINYMLGKAEKDEPMTCEEHACYCASKFCTGTMHDAEETFATWHQFLKKQFGPAYKKLPAAYGAQIPLLDIYPASIEMDYPKIHNLFGSEKKSPESYTDASLPSLAELRKRIHETGRRINFPKLGITVDGIKNGFLLAEKN